MCPSNVVALGDGTHDLSSKSFTSQYLGLFWEKQTAELLCTKPTLAGKSSNPLNPLGVGFASTSTPILLCVEITPTEGELLRLEKPSGIIESKPSTAEPTRVPKCHSHMALKSPQGWALYPCPGQPVFNNLTQRGHQ